MIIVLDIIIVLLGTFIAWHIPNLASYFIEHRKKIVEKDMVYKLPKSYNRNSVFFFAIYAIMVVFLVPDNIAWIVLVFTLIAIFGICVDIAIRIIPNVMVLTILLLGILYRILDGGVKSLIGACIAFGLVILIFGLSGVITYRFKGTRGFGMGDLKLSLAIAVALGYPGVLHFFIGMAISIACYCVLGLYSKMLTLGSTFPMCPQIMIGFLFALVLPYLFMLV